MSALCLGSKGRQPVGLSVRYHLEHLRHGWAVSVVPQAVVDDDVPVVSSHDAAHGVVRRRGAARKTHCVASVALPVTWRVWHEAGSVDRENASIESPERIRRENCSGDGGEVDEPENDGGPDDRALQGLREGA